MDMIGLLEKSSWFRRQPATLRSALIAHGRVVKLEPGQWIHGENDPESGIVAVLTGKIRIEAALGANHVGLIDMVGSGFVLGQARGFGGGPRIVTARASGLASVMLVNDTALARIATENPEIWRAISELVYMQLSRSVHLAVLPLRLRPKPRVAARLLAFLGDDIVAQITQSDLAEMCGLSRKVVNTHLADFRRRGLIATGYGGIRIRNRAGLHVVAGL